MNEVLILGILLVIIGVVLILYSIGNVGNVKIGVGGFLGPIPFGFANDKEMLKLIFITIILISLILLLINLF